MVSFGWFSSVCLVHNDADDWVNFAGKPPPIALGQCLVFTLSSSLYFHVSDAQFRFFRRWKGKELTYLEDEDILMMWENVFSKRVDRSDGWERHLAILGPNQVRSKDNSQIWRSHLVQIAPILYLEQSWGKERSELCLSEILIQRTLSRLVLLSKLCD